MSATVVTHEFRIPLSADLVARIADEQADILGIPSFSIAGDANAWTPRPTGQLWERLGECTPNVLSPVYSLRLLDATLNAYIRAGEVTA